MDELLNLISQYLNIELNDINIIKVIESDLKSLPQQDMHLFLLYVKKNSNNNNMNYKSGFQKFNFLIENFKKQRVQLSAEDKLRVDNYVNKLNRIVIILFEGIGQELYRNNVNAFAVEGQRFLSCKSITKNISDYLTKNNMNADKGLKVIDKIGRANICRMVRHSRHTVCEEINATVTELAKRNKEIVLGYSTNNNLELDANMKELIVKK